MNLFSGVFCVGVGGETPKKADANVDGAPLNGDCLLLFFSFLFDRGTKYPVNRLNAISSTVLRLLGEWAVDMPFQIWATFLAVFFSGCFSYST